MKILFIADSLRIGGIERNTLDQLYLLSDLGNPGVVVLLRPESMRHNANFLQAERDLIQEKQIELKFIEGKGIRRLCTFIKIIKQEKPRLIIDYSVLGTVLARITSLFLLSDVSVHCVIQQFPGCLRHASALRDFFTPNLLINSL